MTMDRIPIRTKAESDLLDDAEVIEGYWSGREGDAEPGNNRSLSFWHGWRNGAVDGHHREPDEAQAAHAHDWLKAQRPA